MVSPTPNPTFVKSVRRTRRRIKSTATAVPVPVAEPPVPGSFVSKSSGSAVAKFPAVGSSVIVSSGPGPVAPLIPELAVPAGPAVPAHSVLVVLAPSVPAVLTPASSGPPFLSLQLLGPSFPNTRKKTGHGYKGST